MRDQDLFDHFDAGAVPVDPVPAAEVRRLGDRMRRRRRLVVTAGTAAAVAAIAVGAAVVGQPGGGRTAPPPADTPSPRPSVTDPAVGAIPADFPIDTAGSQPEPPPGDHLARELRYCGEAPLAGVTTVDARSGQVAGGETSTAVTLLLLQDDDAAGRALRVLLDAAGNCREVVSNVVGEIEVLPRTTDWPGRTIRTTYPADASYVHAVQAGPALLLSSWYVAEAPLALGLVQSREDVAEQLAALDATWDVPGWSPPDGPGSGEDTPIDVPLHLGAQDLTGDGGEVRGPGAEVPGLEDELVCGTRLWSAPGTGRLAFSSTGPAGYADVRELRTFGSAGEAVALMEELRGGFAGCDREVRGGTTLVWTTYPEDTGYDSVTFGSTVEDSLGGAVFQVTRVGRAVVAMMRSGEWALDTAPTGAAELTTVTRQITPEMCTFTEAGC